MTQREDLEEVVPAFEVYLHHLLFVPLFLVILPILFNYLPLYNANVTSFSNSENEDLMLCLPDRFYLQPS